MSYLIDEHVVMPGADTDPGNRARSAEREANPPGAGRMRVVRKFGSEEQRDQFADRRAAEEAEQEQAIQMQKLMESFAFFNKHTHVVVLESGDSKLATHFPREYAAYCQLVEEYHAAEDADFLVSGAGMRSVVTEMSHIPEDSVVKEKFRLWMRRNGSTGGDVKPCGRPLLGHSSPSGVDIVIEAELDQPLKLTPGTEMRVVVQGQAGTDGSEKRTCVITSEILLKAAQKLMTRRLAILGEIREFVENLGRGGENRVVPLAELNTGIAFVVSEATDSAGAAFCRKEPIQFQRPDHALLTNFKLVLVDGVPSLVSVTVAFGFVYSSVCGR